MRELTETQKRTLAQDAANKYYELAEENARLREWGGAFPFRSYAVSATCITGGTALCIYDRKGDFITNIAA